MEYTHRNSAQNVIKVAKRFQDYNLEGHEAQRSRFPYGSGLKNIPIRDLNEKIKNFMEVPRAQPILKALEPLIKDDRSPTTSNVQSPKATTADDPDPIQKGFKKGFSGIAPTVKADLNYKMLATKDHYEMSYGQHMNDPFKKHYLTYES